MTHNISEILLASVALRSTSFVRRNPTTTQSHKEKQKQRRQKLHFNLLQIDFLYFSILQLSPFKIKTVEGEAKRKLGKDAEIQCS